MRKFKDYYNILGIDRHASTSSIKEAYKKLGIEYHPDSHPNATPEEIKELEKKFSEVTKAYSVLSDDWKKYSYDVKYDAHQEELKAKEEYEKKKITKRTSIQKQSIIDNIKQAYKEVKEEEKRKSISKRHKLYDEEIYEKYYDDSSGYLSFQFLRGTIHIGEELMYQLEKLGETRGSFFEYIIRNRISLTGGILAICLLSPLCENKKVEPIPTDGIVVTDENKDEFQSCYSIYRHYTVQAGDTLSQLAVDANTSVESIEHYNELGDLLLMGEKIIIPYRIMEEDLKYCTTTKEFPSDTTLEEFASEHSTDVISLIRLNEESIIEQDDVYSVLSDTLVVPTFESKSEINELKQAEEKQPTKTYTYTNE